MQSLISLKNFYGPINLLLQLVQQKELDVLKISITSLTEQFENSDMDESAEFLFHASSLLWLKSRSLLPSEEVEEAESFSLETIYHVADYLRFRNIAYELSSKEEGESLRFPRGIQPEIPPKELETVSIEELASLLNDLLARHKSQAIADEEFKVADALENIRKEIKLGEIAFSKLFSLEKSREELIVNFLALLELIKMQELKMVRRNEEIVFSNGG